MRWRVWLGAAAPQTSWRIWPGAAAPQTSRRIWPGAAAPQTSVTAASTPAACPGGNVAALGGSRRRVDREQACRHHDECKLPASTSARTAANRPLRLCSRRPTPPHPPAWPADASLWAVVAQGGRRRLLPPPGLPQTNSTAPAGMTSSCITVGCGCTGVGIDH